MSNVNGNKKVKDVGSWQQILMPTYSKRIEKGKERSRRTKEICLERAHAEMKAYEQYKNEPRIIQRARFLETYLREKTIFILEDELIVGNITSKVHSSTISGEMSNFVEKELDDPVKDFEVRPGDKHIIYPEERAELRELLIPYFKGKTCEDYIYETADAEIKEKAYPMISSCPHIPSIADATLGRDAGHQTANYEKVLHEGLKGIKEEVKWYMAQLDQSHIPYKGIKKEKRDFYQAVLIGLDAAMAYAKRYADLARETAAKEDNPERKQELLYIAEVCDLVPANPARDWWTALQAVWMIHTIIHCEFFHIGNSFGRFDQYMYPFYKKSVIDEKTMSRDEALELLDCFWIKTNEFAMLSNYEYSMVATGEPLSQCLTFGGQTSDGQDACNEVTMLCMEAEEQVMRLQPDPAMRIWEGTPDKYLKKAAEVVRSGTGKLKIFGDRKGIQMVAKAYPDRPVEDLRGYGVAGCTETVLPHITSSNAYEGVLVAAKLLELLLNNGKCALCGKQIGPVTGDPRIFESMSAVRQAFREQVFYWMKHLAKGIKVVKEAQARMLPAPFCSSLSEGPLQKGIDITQGGALYAYYGLFLAGVADTADSLAVIDKLIYRDKKITWDQLLDAIKANWKGYEALRQLCINSVPKYGNDNDFADDWAAWVMDTWYDSVDWINIQKDLLPYWGGKYVGATMIAVNNVLYGQMVSALPNGKIHPRPIADTLSPVQGMDKNGPSAVIKSVSKLPTHRFALGGPINLRLNPQLLATEKDLDNFVAFLRTAEEWGIYHMQFNVVSSDLLRMAMKEPENYRDLLVRAGSYCAYFVELAKEQQLDVINRTEQQQL
jgi:pyruvate formate-lyase/glycerol dehydratase family glycyl radical enzyme